VHLEGTNGSDNDGAVGLEARSAALDVEELLATNISTEASLGDTETVLTNEPQRHLVSNDRAVTMGNVGKRASMDEHGGALEGLHQSGLDGVLHEDSGSASNTEIVASKRGSLNDGV